MSLGIDDSGLLQGICRFCSRFRSYDERTCDAFPDGIPKEVWNGENLHGKNVAGDHGLLFNPLTEPDGQESALVMGREGKEE